LKPVIRYPVVWRLAIKTLTLLLLLTFSVAIAQEDVGLYAPAPPPDAAFVRVVNATAGEIMPTLGDTAYGAQEPGAVSPYRVVLQGTADLSAGDVTAALELSAGRFYTVILTGSAQLIEDPTLTNRTQALLLLYNLSDTPVNLKTADGSTDVIPDVAPGEVGSIPVNPISVAFGAFAGDAVLQTFEEVSLERGAAYSTFVLPEGSAVFAQSTTTTE
jgi:alginate O-acetyltransferase complex protein AlgF